MKYFGTDGIRNKSEYILEERIALYIGKGLKAINEKKKAIFIARDTRRSGEKIVSDLKKGLSQSGIDFYDLGVFPTPVLAYFSLINKTYGIMITASHNPYEDNGIKIFDKGRKISQENELILEEVIDQKLFIDKEINKGKEIDFKNPMEKYLKLYKGLLKKTNFKICLDLANGAAVRTAEEVFGHISDDLIIIANKPDGININKDCGSTHLDNLKKNVLEHQCDFGIAFDGDADRLLVVDSEASVIDGDFLIYLMAKYLKEHNNLNNNYVALSQMCNIGIINALNHQGIDVTQTKVGDKYISKAIEENNGVLGGENSGHIINKTLFISGDGVLNAAYLVKILSYFKQPLSYLKKEVTYYPAKLVNLSNIDKTLVNHPLLKDVVNKNLQLLKGDGKILVRASGTEPLIRISVSAATEKLVDQIISDIKATINKLVKDSK